MKQNIKNLKYFRGSRWFESKIYNNFDFATQKYTINICQNLNLGKKLQNLKNSKYTCEDENMHKNIKNFNDPTNS